MKITQEGFEIDFTPIIRFWWRLRCRCEECGGSIIEWDYKHAFCEDCRKEY